jgi:hypothetical protein
MATTKHMQHIAGAKETAVESCRIPIKYNRSLVNC